MRLRVIFSLILITALISFIVGIIFLINSAIEDTPRAATKIEFSAGDIARAKLLAEKYDPRNLKESEISSLSINNREINILTGYLVDRLRRSNLLFPQTTPLASEVILRPKRAEWIFTIGLPESFLGNYLNCSIFLAETKEKPIIDQITIGRIPLRDKWITPVHYLWDQLIRQLGLSNEFSLLLGVVKEVHFQTGEMTVVYEWKSEVAEKLVEKGRTLVISDQDRESIIAYNNHIAGITRGMKTTETSLIYFTKPVFDLAYQRSEKNGRPRAENRAAILVLTMFVNNRPVTSLSGNPMGKVLPLPKDFKATLYGRNDLSKHFMLSAAMTILADSELANMIGLLKEIEDLMGGSGFSFADLLADRAGVRFAELSMANEQQAKSVQLLMARVVRESEFMPSITGLKEGLMQKTFKQRYRDMDSKAFKAEKQEIEKRIDECSLYKVK